MAGVINYDRYEAQGAHLNPNSRGGDAILKLLAKAT
jgi:hypothetical protein